MVVTISQVSKDRITLVGAPIPSAVLGDSNVGKSAEMISGVYRGLRGIVYPKRYSVLYDILQDDSTIGDLLTPSKDYLLLFFFENGELFCGVGANPDEISFDVPYDPATPGEGTSSSPFPCGTGKINSIGDSNQTIYHSLPDTAGTVTITYDMYALADSMDVYFTSDTTLKVASTNGAVSMKGQLTFYYDPAFNSSKVMVVMTATDTDTFWEYSISCPKPIA